MTENQYRAKLIKKLKAQFPGCVVLKNDPSQIQGIPDLLILWEDNWAALEIKIEEGAERQPNQEYYVGKMDDMSYAAFIHPDNEAEVLHELQLAFGIGR